MSSIFVGGDSSGVDPGGVGDCVGAGVEIGIGVCVGEGDALPMGAEEVGDDGASGELSFCADGVGLGVGDIAAFCGVGVTVADLRVADGDAFFFAVAVGVGLGEGVCALRSTPR